MSTELLQNEQTVVTELLEDRNDEEEFAFHQISGNLGFDFIFDGRNGESIFYRQPPKDDYYPLMIFARQRKGTVIVAKSAQEQLIPEFQRLWDFLSLVTQEESKSPESADDVNYNISRPLQGLADIVMRFRQNYNEFIDPSIPKKRRSQKLLDAKQEHFQTQGYKHMITMIENHIDTLIAQLDFPFAMFGKYKEYANKALNSDDVNVALQYGMKLVLCAEIVMPVTEEIMPIKRVTENISIGV